VINNIFSEKLAVDEKSAKSTAEQGSKNLLSYIFK